MTSVDSLLWLDNPAWHSLTGPHERFAQVRGRARRYHPDVCAFAALPDERDESTWSDLAALAGPGAAVAVNGADVRPPARWEVIRSGHGVQMTGAGVDAAPDAEAVVLTAADAPEMLALVERTRPGPFRPRAHELGTYLGIRRDGRLVAMAGERLRPPGWTEISAVCTDDGYRGQGLAGRLVRAVTWNIRARGDQAVLHAAAANTGAIALYEKLGFELRRETVFAAVRTPARS